VVISKVLITHICRFSSPKANNNKYYQYCQ